MPKQTTVIDFEDKEIRDLLIEKAKEALGKPTNGGVEVSMSGRFQDKTTQAQVPLDSLSVRITFNGKVDR